MFDVLLWWKIAFELLKIASSAPLKYGSVMFLYSIGVLPS